jgi:peptidoglycan/xylan/chitin deacetylase (PgdA/CDA1 family)
MLNIPIFYYHSIGNIGPETLSIDCFKRHLSLLAEAGFTTLTVSELFALDADDCGKYVALTFDDGLLDNYQNAAPILQEYGCKATFFVIPGFDAITRWVNPKTRQWSDESKPGYSIPFPSMQPHQRHELSDMGMEIGCHSMTHPKLNKIPVDALCHEMIASKKILEDQLGKAVTSFCYPKGRYNRAVLDYVEQAGYQSAFTTMPAYFGSQTARFECGRFLIESPLCLRKY